MKQPLRTLEDFGKLLSRTPRTWRVTEDGYLLDRLRRCPAQVVARVGANCTAEAREFLDHRGLPNHIFWWIVDAADNEGCPGTRRKLLRWCGIKEQK